MFKSLYIKSDHRVLTKNKEDTSGAQEFEPDYSATVWSNLNIYWFIGIQICCQRLPTNSYSVTFNYSYYSVGYLMSDNKGCFKLFAPT